MPSQLAHLGALVVQVQAALQHPPAVVMLPARAHRRQLPLLLVPLLQERADASGFPRLHWQRSQDDHTNANNTAEDVSSGVHANIQSKGIKYDVRTRYTSRRCASRPHSADLSSRTKCEMALQRQRHAAHLSLLVGLAPLPLGCLLLPVLLRLELLPRQLLVPALGVSLGSDNPRKGSAEHYCYNFAVEFCVEHLHPGTTSSCGQLHHVWLLARGRE